MINSLKSIIGFFKQAHPLRKFEQYVEKNAQLADYVKSFGVVKGLMNFYYCRIKRSGQVSVYYNSEGNRCVLRAGSADVMVFEQVFLFHDYEIEFKKDPEYIIDAGAHIGLASLYFSNRFPDATIICLEPESNNFHLLEKNIKKSSRITPLNYALWSFAGEIFLQNFNANTWAFQVAERKSNISVPTVDIQTLIDRYQLPCIDILKVDIEGSEKTLFSNNPDWTKQVNYIVIETHDHLQSETSTTVENALIGPMQLIQRRGENWVYERCELI